MLGIRGRQGIMVTFAITFVFALAGCATVQYDEASEARSPYETGQLLRQAGFQEKHPGTPEELRQLEMMTQRRLIPKVQNGGINYVYADATYCKCLYVGTEGAYHRYLDLAKQERATRERRESTRWRQERGMDWTAVGSPWGPNP